VPLLPLEKLRYDSDFRGYRLTSQKLRVLGDIHVSEVGAFRDRQRQGRGACRRAGSPWTATLDLQAKQDSVVTQAAVERTGTRYPDPHCPRY
jgi:hypothetical protein